MILLKLMGLKDFVPGNELELIIYHKDGSNEKFNVSHSYNESQIEWFKAGSALNLIRLQTQKG